ncbi:hypothetical protein CO652_00400 [Rhizobium sp. H4]|nr:hypothetical protein CO652_00400 [Rhizobium sp. H4]
MEFARPSVTPYSLDIVCIEISELAEDICCHRKDVLARFRLNTSEQKIRVQLVERELSNFF